MWMHKFQVTDVALAEWLRRVPAKYMGFPRKSSNLLGDDGYNTTVIPENQWHPVPPISLLLFS